MPHPDAEKVTGSPAHQSDGRVPLSLEQKVRLLTGADAWTVHGEPALKLRPIVMSDGPVGVRGTGFDPENPSSSLPCPVALAATWDEDLVARVTRALGEEARSKGIDLLLGPTINLVRTPLSGRGFECFSEDPLLTARIAVAYVRGLQQAGVATTAKHYVGNDSEDDRRNYDARISERTLRELYLVPFEALINEADVPAFMAAYNSVNGAPMTANRPLLRDLLKGELKFRGIVVSDWSATKTTVQSALAGLDLVMPGPGGPWGALLVAAVRAGKVPESEIDDKVERLLYLAARVGAIGESAPERPRAPALVNPALLREVAARSFVLLRNSSGLLPLKSGSVKRVALIGPNALMPQTQGGGSVRVLPVTRPDLAESLRAALGGEATISTEQGVLTWPTVPAPADGMVRDPLTGKPGVRLQVRSAEGRMVRDEHIPGTVLTWWDKVPDAVHLPGVRLTMCGRYRPEVDGVHLVGAAGVGRLSVLVDGKRLAEAINLPPREVVEALSRPPELRVPVQFQKGREVDVEVEYRPDIREGEIGFVTMRLGISPEQDEARLIADAVESARNADVAVVVVGSADGTESEGFDRETLALPGRQDELVRKVAAANPNTVVVVNSGTAVLMPWVEEVSAVLQVWFPGQAFGDALADVLTGSAEPGGRLPVTLPRSEEDSPVLRAHPVAGELVYAEGLLMGYRGLDRKLVEPLFCFGHGLGYTEWTYESLRGLSPSVTAGHDLPVMVTVRNAGKRPGHEVVQVYVEGPDDDPSRPIRVLAAFASVSAAPGESVEVRLTLPARAFARFDENTHRWDWTSGTYRLCAGRSSRDLRLDTSVVQAK